MFSTNKIFSKREAIFIYSRRDLCKPIKRGVNFIFNDIERLV